MDRDRAPAASPSGDGGPSTLLLGASGGIGSALARLLHRKGHRLTVGARNEDALARLAGETGAWPVATDATDFGSVEAAVAAAVERHGRIDAAVNCVGSVLLRPAHLTSQEAWADVVATNLTSAFATVRAAAKPMMAQQAGAIVLVSSAAAGHGLPNHEAIAAAKGGVEGLVRSAAATYGRAGIRVNAVAPGLVETPATERITSNDRSRKASESMHALGRIGQPQEVAAAIAWLLSDEASWITGQVVGVDGGLSRARAG